MTLYSQTQCDTRFSRRPADYSTPTRWSAACRIRRPAARMRSYGATVRAARRDGGDGARMRWACRPSVRTSGCRALLVRIVCCYRWLWWKRMMVVRGLALAAAAISSRCRPAAGCRWWPVPGRPRTPSTPSTRPEPSTPSRRVPHRWPPAPSSWCAPPAERRRRRTHRRGPAKRRTWWPAERRPATYRRAERQSGWSAWRRQRPAGRR